MMGQESEMMDTTRWIAIAVAAVALVGAGLYVPLVALQPAGTTSSTSTTCTTSTFVTTTSTTTVSTSVSTSTAGVSYTYSPTTPVKVDAVAATVTQGQGGEKLVTFQMAFENVGTSPIYIIGGCGSGLYATVPANSPVLQKNPGGPLCACAEFIAPLDPGQSRTATTPGCWSGYNFRLVQPGTVDVVFKLYWGTDGQNFKQSNYTNVTATFTFA